jgi:hypothetical protein
MKLFTPNPPIINLPATPLKNAGLMKFIIVLTIFSAAISLIIPGIYSLPQPNIVNKKLGFLYVQYNPDSPHFFYAALRFPSFYKQIPARIGRPLFSLLLKPIALSAAYAVKALFPRSGIARLSWGNAPAIEHITIYYGWLFLNFIFFGLFLYFTAQLLLAYLHADDVKLLLLVLSISAPAVLALSWLHTIIVGWLVVAASFVLFQRFLHHSSWIPVAALIGILLLGKVHITIILLGALCFFDWRRIGEWLMLGGVLSVPSVVWYLWCKADPVVWELQLVARDVHGLNFSRWVNSLPNFFYENAIGLVIVLGPVGLFFAARGLKRFSWKLLPIRLLCLAVFVELLAFFILSRNGSLYMFGLFYVLLPLLLAGARDGSSAVFSKNQPSIKPHTRIVIAVSQIVWLPIAVYAQLLLWRNGYWF